MVGARLYKATKGTLTHSGSFEVMFMVKKSKEPDSMDGTLRFKVSLDGSDDERQDASRGSTQSKKHTRLYPNPLLRSWLESIP